MEVVISWHRSGTPAASREAKAASPARLRVGRAEDCDIVLGDDTVSRYHATIEIGPGGLTVTDLGSGNGTFLAGSQIATAPWQQGDVLSIGFFELQFAGVDVGSILLPAAAPAERGAAAFPGDLFITPTVPFAAIKASGKLTAEVTYAAVGGGLGSFVWVDHLRVFGVPAGAIRVLGIAPDRKPYAKYARLCRNSQIPDHERIRSNSISAPDNVWGFPGYALRECWSELNKGNPGGLRHLWQVFAEPAFAESYTPCAGQVFASLDAEAKRIGWNSMWVDAQVLQIRKTDDERYVVAYRVPREAAKGGPRELFMVARQLHIATGYPASNFLPDLQDFRSSHPNAGMVVNAYEEHETIYEALAREGGTVLIRGRGIVASRVIQRLSEVRAKNKCVRAVHLMRSPVAAGSSFGLARRAVHANVEHQPFNWPKACWGGSLRQRIEKATPEQRREFFSALGGTTTAYRADWRQIIEEGLASGWYSQAFGGVAGMTLQGGKVVSRIEAKDSAAREIEADYVIDCTGLIAKLDAMPLLKDLGDTYALPRNNVSGNGPEQRLTGFTVSNAFEIEGLRNGRGMVHASGVVTSNGPYAAVDSFLGLQYAALRSIDNLYARGSAGLKSITPMRSARQWLRWCRGAAP